MRIIIWFDISRKKVLTPDERWCVWCPVPASSLLSAQNLQKQPRVASSSVCTHVWHKTKLIQVPSKICCHGNAGTCFVTPMQKVCLVKESEIVTFHPSCQVKLNMVLFSFLEDFWHNSALYGLKQALLHSYIVYVPWLLATRKLQEKKILAAFQRSVHQKHPSTSFLRDHAYRLPEGSAANNGAIWCHGWGVIVVELLFPSAQTLSCVDMLTVVSHFEFLGASGGHFPRERLGRCEHWVSTQWLLFAFPLTIVVQLGKKRQIYFLFLEWIK